MAVVYGACIREQGLPAFRAQRVDDGAEFQQAIQPVALESGRSQSRGDGLLEGRSRRVSGHWHSHALAVCQSSPGKPLPAHPLVS
jgi:hypothetical protein